MKKFRKINLPINTKIMELKNVKRVCIYSMQNNDETKVKALKNVGDLVKIGEPIFINENGDKILSSISGKVIKIGTHIDFFDNIVEAIEIENDFKNEDFFYEKEDIKTEQDFIKMCKDFGLSNHKFYLSKFFEKLHNNDLIIDAFYDNFNTKNYQFLINFNNEILEVLKSISMIFKTKNIKIFVNKKSKSIVAKYLQNSYKYITKNKKPTLSFNDLINIYFALNKIPQTSLYLSVLGGALKCSGIIKLPLGTNLQNVVDFCGGIKQNIEEIENYKYTAMLAFNDELELKNKIKICKNKDDKEKLKKLLLSKQNEAKENIFSKLKDYHKKYLECLSACLVNNVKDKIFIKNFDNYIQNDIFSVSFLSNKEFN